MDSFHGMIPDGLLYDPRHDMWVRREGDEVVVGATAFGLHLAGRLIAFTAKPAGAVVGRDRGLATVECSKTVLAVHSPISLVITAINTAAEDRPALLADDPYAGGWMVRGRPSAWAAESATLIGADEYRRHVLGIEPDAIIEAGS